jgi:hypothetical protein
MRIPNWPALVCGWMLAAMIGQTVLADNPDDELPETTATMGADGDFGPVGGFGNAAGFGGLYQPAQFSAGGTDGSGDMPPGWGYGAAGMPAQNAWPQTSPFTQHRIEETFNEGGVWQYNSDDNFDRKYTFGLEYLYGQGIKPGVHLIGAPQFRADDFFPGFPGVFAQQTTHIYPGMFHNGMRVRWGYENPDHSGVALSGFWLFENSLDNSRLLSQAQTGNILTLLTRGSIVLDNGDGTGQNVPLDSQLLQKWTQSIGGADFDYFSAPFFERNSLKLSMTFGAKYLRISEQFFVQGRDSGLGYVVTLPSGAISYNTVTFVGIPPYTLFINSTTTSNLVGPQLGLRYELGGDRLRFWGATKFAVAGNIEHINVSGSNVVQGFQVGSVTAPPTTHTQNSTHVAPIFDTSINMEFPVFSMIPWVNKMALFKTANLRIGYNWVYAWEISRAVNVIRYTYADPTIGNGRTAFQFNAVNFGVDWKW